MAARIQTVEPGVFILVWICPDGSVLDLPPENTHFAAVPKDLASSSLVSRGRLDRTRMAEVNALGYYRGAIINERLYVLLNSNHSPNLAQRGKLKEYARRKHLARGIIFERRRS